ncbi:MAG: (2Fe-2S)-binding protein [Deltaproteobacteria bacterium]|nr:(2Fe-2S)-binding protein [Deltaproteobacteria bacterium]
MTLALRVNGQTHPVEVEPYELLLDVLRDRLNLTGPKDGCGEGVCGACTVLLDGRPISSCLLLAAYAEGSEIATVEGLARDGGLHPLQRAFIEHGAFQCGYCTPGMLMMAKALLDRTPRPSEAQVREFMSGNICRCTSYVEIIQAVLRAGDG